MELWLILFAVSALCLIVVIFLAIQHASRSKEQFIAIEAQALNDVSQGVPGCPAYQAYPAPRPWPAPPRVCPKEVVSTPLRYRYVMDGSERLGHLGNPWGLPSVPHILQGNTIRAYFSPTRNEAYLDCRTTLFRIRFPIYGFLLSLTLGLILLLL